MTQKNGNGKSTWQAAAQEAMRQATEAEVARKHGELASFNYRWEHVTAVVTLAQRLAEITGADMEVVEAAAWLHDIRKDAKDDHPQKGAIFAREFLPQTDFPPEKIEAVAQAIEDHMGLWRDEPLTRLESQVLWDADKLAKIGLTAVFHWTGRALAGEKTRTTEDLLERGRDAEWQEKTVASMHTDAARRAAQARLAEYEHIWNQLERELHGEDLQ